MFPPLFYPVVAAARSPASPNTSLASLELGGGGGGGRKQFEHTDHKVLEMAPEPDLHLATNT